MKTDKADLVKLIFVLMKGRQEHTIPANGNEYPDWYHIEYKLISLQTISQFIQNPLSAVFYWLSDQYSFTCISSVSSLFPTPSFNILLKGSKSAWASWISSRISPISSSNWWAILAVISSRFLISSGGNPWGTCSRECSIVAPKNLAKVRKFEFMQK